MADGYIVAALNPQTWDAFADPAERHIFEGQAAAAWAQFGPVAELPDTYDRPEGKGNCVMRTTVPGLRA